MKINTHTHTHCTLNNTHLVQREECVALVQVGRHAVHHSLHDLLSLGGKGEVLTRTLLQLQVARERGEKVRREGEERGGGERGRREGEERREKVRREGKVEERGGESIAVQ